MPELSALGSWDGDPGEVTVWVPTDRARAAAGAAPLSPVPPSRQQEQHLRSFQRHDNAGEPMARLLTLAWEERGRCDRRAMTHAITAHLRRHDTYRSSFNLVGEAIVRRVIDDPRDIEMQPRDLGAMDSGQWRTLVLSTPSPLTWDCFSFGVIQRADSFTVFATIDHLHADALFVVQTFSEIHRTYVSLAAGGGPPRLPDAGSYLDYCQRQDRQVQSMSLQTPDVHAWVAFLQRCGGTLPEFPLPLGDLSGRCLTDIVTATLLDHERSEAFESACVSIGVRPVAGVLAAAAFTERQLASSDRYNVITPTTTRSTPEDTLTAGWFTGVVPISIDVSDLPFADIARSAQTAFDAGLPLAHVPVERVFELAVSASALVSDGPAIRQPGPGVPLLSYLDTGLPPMDPEVMVEWWRHSGRVMLNRGGARQIGFWVTRTPKGMSLAVAYPDNPEARGSVDRYVERLRRVCVTVAEGRADEL